MASNPEHCPECGCVLSSDIFTADNTRKRFFATLRDVHSNLTENPTWLARWPNSEIFRKHGLIAVGWCDMKNVVITSKHSALEMMTLINTIDAYRIVTIDDPGPRKPKVVTIYTAKSMSRRDCHKPDLLIVMEKFFHWVYQTTGIDASGSEAV